mmetsp:Transcript_70776/g.169512  ORF Transcript_70776/g.169512 Transcript_70776/m.169512 type:complete len:205 (+) Transcript_70776:193-807(+)
MCASLSASFCRASSFTCLILLSETSLSSASRPSIVRVDAISLCSLARRSWSIVRRRASRSSDAPLLASSIFFCTSLSAPSAARPFSSSASAWAARRMYSSSCPCLILSPSAVIVARSASCAEVSLTRSCSSMSADASSRAACSCSACRSAIWSATTACQVLMLTRSGRCFHRRIIFPAASDVFIVCTLRTVVSAASTVSALFRR